MPNLTDHRRVRRVRLSAALLAAALLAVVIASEAAGHSARLGNSVTAKKYGECSNLVLAPCVPGVNPYTYWIRGHVKGGCKYPRLVTVYRTQNGVRSEVGESKTRRSGWYGVIVQHNGTGAEGLPPIGEYHAEIERVVQVSEGHQHTCGAASSRQVDFVRDRLPIPGRH